MRGLKDDDPQPWDPDWEPRLLWPETLKAIRTGSNTIFTRPLKVGPLPSKQGRAALG